MVGAVSVDVASMGEKGMYVVYDMTRYMEL